MLLDVTVYLWWVGPRSDLGLGWVKLRLVLGFGWSLGHLGSSWVRLEVLLKAKAKSGLSFKIICYSFWPWVSPKWPQAQETCLAL
jgi:hypothetical protein